MTAPDATRTPRAATGGGDEPTVVRAGRYAWAALGILGVLAVAGLLAARFTLVLVPVVLALFPAGLLAPATAWLRQCGLPPAAAATATLGVTLAVLAAAVALLVPAVAAELPRLVASANQGLAELQAALVRLPGVDADSLPELFARARDAIGHTGQLTQRLLDVAVAVAEGALVLILGLIALFFYLKDGPRLAAALAEALPAGLRGHAHALAGRVWHTLGAYFRGQLLVATVDAALIGLGLWLLQIPLALPLAFVIFLGGLFPIVGAIVSGTLAVLVALAHGGLVTALVVAGLVIGVQQLESNLLQPFIVGRATRLHPLLVILSVSAGALAAGVLGAFLAVPVAASIARTLDYLRTAGENRHAATAASTAVPQTPGPADQPAVTAGRPRRSAWALLRRPLRLARVAGVEIRTDGAWLAVLSLVAASLLARLHVAFDLALGPAAAVAAIATLLLAASVLAQQLAVTLTDHRRPPRPVIVSVLPAVAAPDADDTERPPAQRLRLAAVLTSLAAAAVFAALAGLAAPTAPAAAVFGYLAWANAALAAVNALPVAAPAAARRITASIGDRRPAPRLVGVLAGALGYLLGLAGLLGLLQGRLLAGGGLLLAGILLAAAATIARRRAGARQALNRWRAEDVMRPTAAVPADLTLAQALERGLLTPGEDLVPFERHGRCVGLLHWNPAPNGEFPDQHLAVPIEELMQPVEPADLVEADEPLNRLWPRLHRRPHREAKQALVVVRDGRPVGVLTRRPAAPAPLGPQPSRQREGDPYAV